MRTGSGNSLASKERGQTFRRSEIAKTLSASARTCIAARNLIERFFNKIKQCRRVAKAMKEGKLRTVKVLGRRLIPKEVAESLLAE